MADWWTDRVVATLRVGPLEEPITVEELKLRARHDRTDEDALLPGYIAAARQQVERDTEWALLRQTWRASVSGSGEVALPWPPLVTVLSVQQVALDGTVTPVDPADYVVDPISTPGRIVLPSVASRYVIDYTAGWATPDLLPPLLVQAVAMLAVHYLTLGRDFASADALALVPYAYLEAVQPFRLVGVA